MSQSRKVQPGESVERWIERQSPELAQLVVELRAFVRETLPSAREVVKWSNPNYEIRGLIAYLAVSSGHVRLGFWNGAHLPDPEGLLEGTGKDLRHVKLSPYRPIPKYGLHELLRAAAAYDARG